MKLGFGLIVVILIVSFVVGGFLWSYTINEWLDYAGKTQRVTWFQGALLGLIPALGQASIPVAAGTWIVMKFIK